MGVKGETKPLTLTLQNNQSYGLVNTYKKVE
jgi:hypothetical protein